MSFFLQKENIYALPIIHYNMESASYVKRAIEELRPDCIAVEFAETMELQLLHAASRLPEISVVLTYDPGYNPIYYLAEPCDAGFEALRSALEAQIPAHCIDLDVEGYPKFRDHLPDPYAITRIGVKEYYQAYQKLVLKENRLKKSDLDHRRELYMAKRLKELSLMHDRVLFVGGMVHVEEVLNLTATSTFPELHHCSRESVQIATLTETSAREVLAEHGWLSTHYEKNRLSYLEKHLEHFEPDRQKLLYTLYHSAGKRYEEHTGHPFPQYHIRNLMKFVRNYALHKGQLMPDLFQILSAAKGCVDHNYAYETWELATSYPFLKNTDNLPELDLTVEDVWGHSKVIRFHMKEKGRKHREFQKRLKKDRSNYNFNKVNPYGICSYPPEDLIVENFGEFLKKKGTQILIEEGARTIPFTSSVEDGIDAKETIRHWHEKKLFVKTKGKPPGGVGSTVIIFNEDSPLEEGVYHEKYPWRTTWLGEHDQESDMAFYATELGKNLVGPGISRCEYGGFMMSYPPRRMFDIWSDPDYSKCKTKGEVLLMAAIDYAVKPVITYVASSPPKSWLKSFAKRYGKKVVYLPIGQLSPVTLKKIRVFHVLDGHDKRGIAGEYIF